jgi:hypothetical protein
VLSRGEFHGTLECITQETAEHILGRLLTDARQEVLRGLRRERESLAKLECAELEWLIEMIAERLDPRIVRGEE